MKNVSTLIWCYDNVTVCINIHLAFEKTFYFQRAVMNVEGFAFKLWP